MLCQIHSQVSKVLHKAPCHLNEQQQITFLKLLEVLHFYEIKC